MNSSLIFLLKEPQLTISGQALEWRLRFTLYKKTRRLDHPAPGAVWPDQREAAAAIIGHGEEPGSHWVTSWQHNHTGATAKLEEYIF